MSLSALLMISPFDILAVHCQIRRRGKHTVSHTIKMMLYNFIVLVLHEDF